MSETRGSSTYKGGRERDTARTMEVYKAIVRLMSKMRIPPTVREIAKEMDYKTTSAVHHQLNRLKDYGYIEIIPEVSRGIVLTGMLEDTGVSQEEGK